MIPRASGVCATFRAGSISRTRPLVADTRVSATTSAGASPLRREIRLFLGSCGLLGSMARLRDRRRATGWAIVFAAAAVVLLGVSPARSGGFPRFAARCMRSDFPSQGASHSGRVLSRPRRRWTGGRRPSRLRRVLDLRSSNRLDVAPRRHCNVRRGLFRLDTAARSERVLRQLRSKRRPVSDVGSRCSRRGGEAEADAPGAAGRNRRLVTRRCGCHPCGGWRAEPTHISSARWFLDRIVRRRIGRVPATADDASLGRQHRRHSLAGDASAVPRAPGRSRAD